MRSIALIPARYAASRFPGKLMQKLGDKTIIRHSYENTLNTLLFDEVIVVTDSDIIFKEIVENGGYALMGKKEHESGSDRIAEAAAVIQADIIINVQGDEPFIQKETLQNEEKTPIQVASLMHEIKDHNLIADPNTVKVVTDKNWNALLFSRSVLPYQRDKSKNTVYYKHIGIYGYRRKALLDFAQMHVSPLEAIEKLEQLRYLENGIKIRMVLTNEAPISIDTPEDLERARKMQTLYGK